MEQCITAVANRHSRNLDVLFEVAQTNSLRAKLAASIVIGNRVVSIGVNSYKTHPMQARYSRNPASIHVHAEIDAICKALRKVPADALKRSTLYVARAKRGKSGKFVRGLAKPCTGCAAAIAGLGIKHVVYTEDSA